jgi:hypothetical protein
MRILLSCLACAALFACGNSLKPQALDGVWQLATAHSPLDPRTLTLTQHEGTVTGTSTAMGVDAPLPVTVTGNVSLPAVTLTFSYSSGVARYTATLQLDGRMVGQAVYDSTFGGMTDSLTYTKR